MFAINKSLLTCWTAMRLSWGCHSTRTCVLSVSEQKPQCQALSSHHCVWVVSLELQSHSENEIHCILKWVTSLKTGKGSKYFCEGRLLNCLLCKMFTSLSYTGFLSAQYLYWLNLQWPMWCVIHVLRQTTLCLLWHFILSFCLNWQSHFVDCIFVE